MTPSCGIDGDHRSVNHGVSDGIEKTTVQLLSADCAHIRVTEDF
jgi:hypothetical protein